MGLAVLATVDARRVEVDVIGEPHGGDRRPPDSVSSTGLYLKADKMWSVPSRWLCGGPLNGTRAAGANGARVEVGGKGTPDEEDLERGRRKRLSQREKVG